MDYHTDRSVRYEIERDLDRLYKWSLQECGSDGEPLGAKYIPWDWRLSFIAVELRHTHNVAAETDLQRKPLPHTTSETFAFLLRPEGGERPPPSFSMFGTDRTVEKFYLRVQCVDEGATEQSCAAWGVVSYTSEVDFRSKTEDDSLGFELWLTQENFEILRQVHAAAAGDHCIILTIGRVGGFYSPWSPSISTHDVKILARGDQQQVLFPESGLDVPRLGRIQEFSLHISRRMPLGPWRSYEAPAAQEAPVDVEKANPSEAYSDALASIVSEVQHLRSRVDALTLPIWLLVSGLVILMLLR